MEKLHLKHQESNDGMFRETYTVIIDEKMNFFEKVIYANKYTHFMFITLSWITKIKIKMDKE